MSNFAERYAGMTNEELLSIASSGDDLNDDAQQAFSAEVDRRGIRERAERLHRRAVEARTPPQPQPLDPEPGFDPSLLRVDTLTPRSQDERVPDKDRKLVVLERFRDLIPAQLALGALLSAGIDAALFDENMVRLNWFRSDFIGGVRLVVPLEEAESAKEILNAPMPEKLDAGDGDSFEHPACPSCGSRETFFTEGSVFLMALSIPPQVWYCDSCLHFWKADNI